MKFEYDKFFVEGSKEITISQHEGGYAWVFAQRALSSIDIDCSECDFFEVGPKHGMHTLMIDEHNPKSITCVEAPNKLRSNDRFAGENRRWVPHIKTENFELHYQDFDNFVSDRKYNLLFYTGVFYHNVNQIGQLQKLYNISSDDAYMIFESSTTRNEEYMDKNIIEVHYPPYSPMFRDVQTCVFHPSKLACKTMLNIAGWDIVATSDDYEDTLNPERINILCKKGIPRKNRHFTDENLHTSPE